MIKLRFEDAEDIARQVNCSEALAATTKLTNDRQPPKRIESTIICKHKIRQGEGTETNLGLCCVVDGQPCPLNKVPEQKLIQIRKQVEQASGREKT